MEGEDKSDEDLLHYRDNVCAQTLLTSNIESFYGYLKKFNPRDKAQSRFCIIDKGTFFYYRDAESPKPKGHFQLEGYQAHIEKSSHQPHTFKLEHRITPHIRAYKFSCVSEKELSSWVDYINKHVIEYFPVSLYIENDNSEFYDYVPGEVLDTLSREYKKKTIQEGECKNASSSSISSSSKNAGETPEVPARTLRMNREYDMSQENKQLSQGNIMRPGYVCMDFSRMNTMKDGYVEMNSRNDTPCKQGSNNVEDPYVAVIDGSDSDSEEGDKYLTTVGDIIAAHRNKQQDKTVHHRSYEPNNDMNELDNMHNEITSINLTSEQSQTNRAETEIIPVSPLEAIYPPKANGSPILPGKNPGPTKAKRSGTLPLGPESPIVTKEDRSQSLPFFPPETADPVKDNRSFTLPNMRAAIPPPIPKRRPVVEAPILENLYDHVILPKSCIHANIQKDQCSNLLFPFEIGTYLVRTERRDGKDALAILAEKNPQRVKHFIVFESADGKRYLHKDDPKFETLQELIRYYYYNLLPQTEIRLIKPLPSTLLNRVEENDEM